MKIELELGTEIREVLGLMENERVGKIDVIDYINTPDLECKVNWDDGSHTWMLLSEIREDYLDPKGSPSGYFATEAA